MHRTLKKQPSTLSSSSNRPRSGRGAGTPLAARLRLLLRSARHRLASQWQLAAFLSAFFAVNAALAAHRAGEFVGMRNLDGSTPNLFYMVSRACGESERKREREREMQILLTSANSKTSGKSSIYMKEKTSRKYPLIYTYHTLFALKSSLEEARDR